MSVRMVESALSTKNASVEIRSVLIDQAAEVTNRFENSCFISFALEPRPANSRGHYKDFWGPARTEEIGDVLFVPKGMTMVGSCASAAHRYAACELNADLFETDWQRLSDRAYIETLSVSCADVKRGLRRLVREVIQPNLGSPLALDALAMLLAVDIQRWLEGFDVEREHKIGGLSPARMRKLEERIHSEERTIPTLIELADHCNLSPRHLARAFREETGKTIGEYVSVAARTRAFKLLRTTDLTIAAIARQVGFSSPASFSYAFRRDTGLKPSDVRKGISPISH